MLKIFTCTSSHSPSNLVMLVLALPCFQGVEKITHFFFSLSLLLYIFMNYLNFLSFSFFKYV